MSKDDFKKLALEGLIEVQVGVSTFDLPTFIQPNTDYEEDYAVALVRCNDNGTGTIVYGAMKQVSLTQCWCHPAKTLMSARKKASPSLMQVISQPNVHATYVSLPPR